MCITAPDTLSRAMSCLYHSQHQTGCLFFTFPAVLFSRMYLSELGNSRFTMICININISEMPVTEWAAHLPWARHNNGGCHQGVMCYGQDIVDTVIVMARLLLMLCLGPAEGKDQGRSRPGSGWWSGKSIKSRWCQTPAGGSGGNEREMCCLWWGPGSEDSLHPPGDSFTQGYDMSASLLIITGYAISGINIQDSVTPSISSLRRDYLTSRLRLRSVGESPSNWGSQESTVQYCAVLCAPCTGSRKQGSAVLSLHCCHRWTNVDIRSLFVRKLFSC